jgi:hypothetical protein
MKSAKTDRQFARDWFTSLGLGQPYGTCSYVPTLTNKHDLNMCKTEAILRMYVAEANTAYYDAATDTTAIYQE